MQPWRPHGRSNIWLILLKDNEPRILHWNKRRSSVQLIQKGNMHPLKVELTYVHVTLDHLLEGQRSNHKACKCQVQHQCHHAANQLQRTNKTWSAKQHINPEERLLRVKSLKQQLVTNRVITRIRTWARRGTESRQRHRDSCQRQHSCNGSIRFVLYLRSIIREVCEVLKTTCHQQGHKQNAPRYQNQAGSPTSRFMSEAALTELLHQVCTAATALTCTSALTDIFIKRITMKGLAFPLTTETGLCPGRRGCGGRL